LGIKASREDKGSPKNTNEKDLGLGLMISKMTRVLEVKVPKMIRTSLEDLYNDYMPLYKLSLSLRSIEWDHTRPRLYK